MGSCGRCYVPVEDASAGLPMRIEQEAEDDASYPITRSGKILRVAAFGGNLALARKVSFPEFARQALHSDLSGAPASSF